MFVVLSLSVVRKSQAPSSKLRCQTKYEYVWDAENRLASATVAGATTTYRYDYLGRRISKKVDTAAAEHFLYDGWNLIAEYTGTNLRKSYTWGMDLSGNKVTGKQFCIDSGIPVV